MVRIYSLGDLNQKATVFKHETSIDEFGGTENLYTKLCNIWVKVEPIIAEQYSPYSPATGMLPSNPTYKVVSNTNKRIFPGDILEINNQKLKVFKIYCLNKPFRMFITEEIQ